MKSRGDSLMQVTAIVRCVDVSMGPPFRRMRISIQVTLDGSHEKTWSRYMKHRKGAAGAFVVSVAHH